MATPRANGSRRRGKRADGSARVRAHQERLPDLLKPCFGLAVATQREASQAEVGSRYHLEATIAKRPGAGSSVEAKHAGFRGLASEPEVSGQVGRDPPELTGIVERSSQAFGFAEIRQHSGDFAERPERISQVESKLDRLPRGVGSVWKTPE